MAAKRKRTEADGPSLALGKAAARAYREWRAAYPEAAAELPKVIRDTALSPELTDLRKRVRDREREPFRLPRMRKRPPKVPKGLVAKRAKWADDPRAFWVYKPKYGWIWATLSLAERWDCWKADDSDHAGG